MKKFSLILFLMILLPLTSGLSSDLHTTYQPAETMLVELQGSILEEIPKENVFFLRGHVQTVVEYDLKKLGNHYFLYAVAPLAENNFTLEIKNVHTTINGQPKVIDYVQNFSVIGTIAPYTLKPSFVLTPSDFTVMIISNKDEQQEISIGNANETQQTIKPGENQISFSIDQFNQGLTILPVGMYELAVYNQKAVQVAESRHLRLTPGYIEERFFYGGERIISFSIANIGQTDLSDITLDYNVTRYKITPEKITKLRVNETAIFNLTLISKNASIDDLLRISSSNETLDMPIRISYSSNLTSTNTSSSNVSAPATGYYCRELSGTLCQAAEVCSGQTRDSLDGNCCIGTCTAQKATSYAWIGYLLGALILVLIVIIGGRYLKSKSSGNIFQKRVAQVERKI
jgi:hypothetical protein